MSNLFKITFTFLILGISIFNTSCTLRKESPKFYSQFKQDKFLHNKVFKGKKNGVFIDIGAHDGVSFNNTYFFEKNLGWTGICIEPIPEVFAKLKTVRTALCIQGCIYDKSETASFLRIQGWSEMLSGILENYDPLHIQRIRNEIEQKGGTSEIIRVQCYNLTSLLLDKDILHVDYLSIDTEGGELEILKSIDFQKIEIDVIDVENNYGTAFQNFLEPLGYKLIKSIGPDEIYQKVK